jgi:hypothetical protein
MTGPLSRTGTTAGALRLSRRVRVLVAAGLFAVQLGALVATERAIGFTRDEATYFQAARDYWSFYGDLGEALLPWSKVHLAQVVNPARIKATFAENSEHPSFMKMLFGWSRHLFYRDGKHPLLHESTALRLPAMVMGALAVALTFLLGADLFGDAVGILAALLLALLPRLFFHSHLACFDVPIAALILLVTTLYARSLRGPGGWKYGVLAGVALGVALATKLPALFAPLFLVPHALFVVLWRRVRLRTLLWPAVSMAVLAPPVCIGLWPWLWYDTVARFRGYLSFFANHSFYNFEYLGKNYNHPPFPWHEPLVLTSLVVPTVVILLALAGGVFLLIEGVRAGLRPLPKTLPESVQARAPGLLMAVTFFPWLAIFMTGKTPIFGAEKHWMACLPALCITAAYAAVKLTVACASELELTLRRARWALVAVGVAVVLPCLCETVRAQPEGLSYYTELAGGFRGGADLGMNRQFWGNTLAQALHWLNANAAPGSRIYLHDGSPAYDQYEREGMLRSDLGDAGPEEGGVQSSSLALVIYEKHFAKYEYMIWNAYKTTRPVWVLTRDDVPLVALYRRTTP